MIDLVVKNGKIVFPKNTLEGSIGIDKGKIVAVGSNSSIPPCYEVINAEGKFVLPGGVESHDHTRIETGLIGTKGISWGGTTTTIRFSRIKFRDVESHIASMKDFVVDHSFHAIPENLTPDEPDNLDVIKDWIEFGIPSFKLFMVYDNFADDNTVLKAFEKCKIHGGLMTLHAENESMVEYNRALAVKNGHVEPIYHALTRPPITEAVAVNMAIYIARQLAVPYMNMHLSIKEGVDLIGQARQRGDLVYGETCPQYLCKTQADLEGPQGLYFICTPPLRPKKHVAALWEGLRDGSMSVVGSDHVTFTKEEKEGHPDFTKVPNGCPGHEFRLPVLWSEGVAKGRITPNRLSEIYATNAAKIYGLYPKKGVISVGSDADLTILDPDMTKKATQEEIEALGIAENNWCLYEGMMLTGWPTTVILRGQVQWDKGEFKGEKGTGRFLKRRLSPDLFTKLIA